MLMAQVSLRPRKPSRSQIRLLISQLSSRQDWANIRPAKTHHLTKVVITQQHHASRSKPAIRIQPTGFASRSPSSQIRLLISQAGSMLTKWLPRRHVILQSDHHATTWNSRRPTAQACLKNHVAPQSTSRLASEGTPDTNSRTFWVAILGLPTNM